MFLVRYFILMLLLLTFLMSCSVNRVDYTDEVVNNHQFLRDWLLCGPFPNCPECSRENYEHDERCRGFATDWLVSSGGETGSIPAEGTQARVDSLRLRKRWFFYRSQTDFIPFNDIFKPNDMVVVYAFCRIECQEKRRAILSVGSNDGVKVFLNGVKVHENHVGRWLQADNDLVPVTLNAGKNNLLVKVDDGIGEFGMAVRFLDYDSTLRQIRQNLDTHKNLSVISAGDSLMVQFGKPYQISVLNPDGDVQIEIFHEKSGKIAEQTCRPGTRLYFPLNSIADGFLTARATFQTPADGTINSEKRHYKGKLKRHARPGNLTQNFVPQKAGVPFFPIGTYGAPPEDYKLLKEAGYNFVVASPENLDAAHEIGLMAAVPVQFEKPNWSTSLEERITKYKNHPALLCWMLYDEPGYNQADLLDIYQVYNLTYQLDPAHASYLVITMPAVYETFGRCCDILAIDTYPISRGRIADVGDNIEKAKKASDGTQALWHCGQLFTWPADRYPTPTEHRFMSYLALIEGAKGILWYSFKWGEHYLPTSASELWEAHRVLLKELNELAPLFMAPDQPEKVVTVGERLQLRTLYKKSTAGDFLIAANCSKTDSVTARFALPQRTKREVKVYGENRQLFINAGVLMDDFSPLAVHIYQIK